MVFGTYFSFGSLPSLGIHFSQGSLLLYGTRPNLGSLPLFGIHCSNGLLY